jgi:large subunit ribosomal protein L9
MEIILLQDVDKLGKRGDVANVAEGYARNFLLPRRLAEIATPSRVAAAKQAMEDRAAAVRREAERADETREMLGKTVVTITATVGTNDRLFGSVTNQDVADAIYQARKVRIDKHDIELDEPIKTVGTHMVRVRAHSSVEPVEVKVIVAPEEEKA